MTPPPPPELPTNPFSDPSWGPISGCRIRDCLIGAMGFEYYDGWHPPEGWPEDFFPDLDPLVEVVKQYAEHQLATAPDPALADAAQAVIDRWDSPLWKDAEPTAAVINRLREALKEWKSARAPQ